MSELESLLARATDLNSKVDFWNSAVLWFLFATAIAAGAIVFSQRLAFVRAKELADVQDQIAKIKEDAASQRANTLRTDLQTETGKVSGLEKAASDAKAAQQKVQIDLAKQQQLAATAEASLIQLKESVKPRRLTPEQMRAISDSLLSTPTPQHSIEIRVFIGAEDGVGLAGDMSKALLVGRWQTASTVLTPDGGNLQGVWVLVNNADPHLQAKWAGCVQQALRAGGIDAQGDIDFSLPKDKVAIFIAPKKR